MPALKLHSNSVVCSAQGVPFSRFHDDLLVIDQDGGYYYSMNPSAARIWELIRQPTSIGTVCSVLCKEFGIAEEECRPDVLELLQALADAGLVSVSDTVSD